MGISTHYLREYNFRLIRLFGEINDQNLREDIFAMNEETRGIPVLRELADCRGIENLKNLSVAGTVHCSGIVYNRPDTLTAILIKDNTLHYGMARVYQMFQDEKRKSVEIFNDIVDALSWLTNDELEIEVLKKFVEARNG